jgi:MFS family permease
MELRRDRMLNCFCSVLMLFVNMGVLSTAFSVYFPYIREMKGFSNTQVFLLTTMRQIFAMIVMTQSDRYFRVLDIKKGSLITFFVAAAAFGILAFTPDTRLYFLATSLFGVAYGLGGMIPASILLRRWYPQHSGTAIGIAAAGSGLAGMIIPVLATRMVEGYGLSAAFAFQGAVILLLCIPLLLFVKDHPAGEELTGAHNSEGEKAAKRGREEVKGDFRPTDHPRLLIGMVLMGLLAFQPAAGFSMLFRTSGYEMGRVALLVSAMGFFLIPSKILVGKFADRFGGKRMLRDCTILVAAMMFLFSLTAFLPYPVLFLVLLVYALGISESSVGISVIAGDYASTAAYPRALKSCQFFYALGGLLFSTVNGMVADLTGSYAPAYVFYALAGLVMLAVLLPDYPKQQ